MEQTALARNPLQQIQEPGVHLVDAVAVLQLHHAIRAAHRTPARWSQVVPVSAGGKLFPLTGTALIDRHVAETFQEGPVNAPKLLTALPALHSMFVISQFAE